MKIQNGLRYLATLCCMLIATSSANAAVVTFDLLGADGLALETTGTITQTVDGVTLTLSAIAIVDGGTGALNQTANDFGINAVGGGDITDAIDDGLGTETIQFNVSSPQPLSNLVLSSVDFDRITNAGLDQGRLEIVGSSSTLFDNATVDGSDILSVNASLSTGGQTLTIAHVAGNGFGLESIAFEATLVAVPEPASAFALTTFAAMISMRRLRKHRASADLSREC